MPKNILICEDEKILAGLLQKKLTQEGYEVFWAQDGNEGLKKMKEKKFDLVLLDILMPELDGFEVIEAMKKDKDLKNIPIVIVSNSGQPVEIERAQKLGVNDWLIKTEFDPKEVVDKVVKQIGR